MPKVGEKLASEALDRRATLPRKPHRDPRGRHREARTYLLLEHAFGLGYRRVEWKCDALNERSRRAAERLGFKFEGIQDAHYIVKGRNRDTAWFRILDHEWPRVREGLGAILRP